jgi:hypothetical protein
MTSLLLIAQAAFLFAYDVDRGKEDAFEAGYAAHLAWHAEHKDPLPWYGWYVTSGPRTGLFIDGTFGIPFAAMDQRVDPVGDGADMTARVLPFAKARTYSALELWPQVSTVRTLEDRKPTAVLDAFTVTVAPKNIAAFETARSREPKGRAAWYRTISGGPTGAYLALVPRQTWTDLAGRPALLGKAAALVEHVEVESWSYRPKLSRIP